jgi:hypothetical protein
MDGVPSEGIARCGVLAEMDRRRKGRDVDAGGRGHAGRTVDREQIESLVAFVLERLSMEAAKRS